MKQGLVHQAKQFALVLGGERITLTERGDNIQQGPACAPIAMLSVNLQNREQGCQRFAVQAIVRVLNR